MNAMHAIPRTACRAVPAAMAFAAACASACAAPPADPPLVRVPFVAECPAVDGVPAEGEWGRAALLVGIGLGGDAARGRLSIGGYEGATGSLGPVETLHQFVVNAGGSPTRLLGECPVRDVRFDGAAGSTDGGWIVEMRIPFEVIGLKVPAGRTVPLHVNAVRIRPPGNPGWHGMSHWGGFQRFPTGRLELLPEGLADDRTLEQSGEPRPDAGPSPGTRRKPVLGFHPLAREVVAVFETEAPADAAITIDGLAFARPRATATCIPSCSSSEPYT
jgi:hypothetical protein